MFFKKKDSTVEKIYQNIVERSRSKFFYIDLFIDDTFEGRFDLIIFHAFIIFYYYKQKELKDINLSQKIFDHMFGDFENNLREMGFGDIAVNKKMKIFIKAFYGRISEYSKSIDLYFSKKDKTLLKETILNNIYKGKINNSDVVEGFAEYMVKNIKEFNRKSEKENIQNYFNFLNFY